MNETQQHLPGGTVPAGTPETAAGTPTLVGQRLDAQQESLQAASEAPKPGNRLTATTAAYSKHHYHHHQAWRHLREAARHISLSRAGAISEDGVVPDWMLAFQPMLQRALEHRPAIEELSD